MILPWLLGLTVMITSTPPPPPDFTAETATRFAELALACVHQEYPNKIAHVMNSDADLRPPRELTPVFHGCYDWHSAVHGHWLLARLARTFPDAPFTPRARAALAKSLTPANIAAEVAYLNAPGRASFEWLRRVDGAGSGVGSGRSEAGAPGRTEPEPGVDAGGDRGGAALHRQAGGRAASGGAEAP